MKQLTNDQRVLKLWAASGQIRGYRKSVDWNLLLSIFGIGAFVGFVAAFLLMAYFTGVR